MRFDFENAEPWDVSTGEYLNSGNYVCTVTSAESNESSGGFPQVELELADTASKGTKKDWLVYKEENGVRKVATLFRAAGVEIKNEDADEATGKLSDAVVAKLVGKTVGVIIRDEPSYKDPSKMQARVKGYVEPGVIGEAPASAAPAATPAGGIADEDIPF